tara:strand:- start:4080 stop:5024 length:945 start_codon:yes stop_codon:yes gene_type:complete
MNTAIIVRTSKDLMMLTRKFAKPFKKTDAFKEWDKENLPNDENIIVLSEVGYEYINEMFMSLVIRLQTCKALNYYIQQEHTKYAKNYYSKNEPKYEPNTESNGYRYWDGILGKMIYISFNDRPQEEAYKEYCEEYYKLLLVKPLPVHNLRVVKKNFKNWWRHNIFLHRINSQNEYIMANDKEMEEAFRTRLCFKNDWFFYDSCGNNCNGEYFYQKLMLNGEATLKKYLFTYKTFMTEMIKDYKTLFTELPVLFPVDEEIKNADINDIWKNIVKKFFHKDQQWERVGMMGHFIETPKSQEYQQENTNIWSEEIWF